ncbi:hypothetical protein ACLOJK_027969 [Asimina triloba]
MGSNMIMDRLQSKAASEEEEQEGDAPRGAAGAVDGVVLGPRDADDEAAVLGDGAGDEDEEDGEEEEQDVEVEEFVVELLPVLHVVLDGEEEKDDGEDGEQRERRQAHRRYRLPCPSLLPLRPSSFAPKPPRHASSPRPSNSITSASSGFIELAV